MLTASDAAAALGVKPYASFRGSPADEALRRKLDNAPISGPALEHGVRYEDEARDAAAAALGETVREVGLFRHPTETWLAASPDGVTLSGKLVEIKCPWRREVVPGQVPHHYEAQVQVQMEVCDIDETLFVQYKPACLTRSGRALLDIAVVPRRREWFAEHRAALHAFWETYMRRRAGHVPPPPPPPPRCLVDPGLYADLANGIGQSHMNDDNRTSHMSDDI